MGAPPTPLTPGQPGPLLPGEFTTSSTPRATTFSVKSLAPPSNLYIERDDILVLSVLSIFATETVTLNCRLLLATGQLNPIQLTFALTSSRALNNFFVQLAEGYLLDATVIPTLATTRGQTFARLGRVRGTLAGAPLGTVLFSDYVTLRGGATWPGGIYRTYVDGPGNLRSITGTLPAAGADINEVVPTNARWRPVSMQASLTTSAAVGNRQVSVTLDDGVNRYYTFPSTFLQTAGTTQTYIFATLGTLQNNVLAETNLPIPVAANLLAGHRIRTLTSGLLAGDAWTAPQYLVEEWLDF